MKLLVILRTNPSGIVEILTVQPEASRGLALPDDVSLSVNIETGREFRLAGQIYWVAADTGKWQPANRKWIELQKILHHSLGMKCDGSLLDLGDI